MAYDPTQRVPPPQGYPPQQGYPQSYPPTQQAGYPPSAYPPPPPTYTQYNTPPQPGYGAPGMPGGFDLNQFWRNLGRTGQICLISAVILGISFLIPWYNVSSSCRGNCQNIITHSYSYNAFAIIGSVDAGGSKETYSFPLILLIMLAALALIALPVIGAMGKMVARQVQLFVLGTTGLALLLEIIFMITAFSSFPDSRDNIKKFNDLFGSQTTVGLFVGPDFGFWLGLLATLAAGGGYLYFNYLKKPGVAVMPAGVYAQPLQYPGAPPYGQPQYPEQPYQPPPYPGSQPYQPPQYPGQPPQYPRQ